MPSISNYLQVNRGTLNTQSLTDNAAFNVCISELLLPNVDTSAIWRWRLIKAAPTGNRFYNAIQYFDATGHTAFFEEFMTQQEAIDNCIGVKGDSTTGIYVVIDFSGLANGTTDFDDLITFLLPINIPSIARVMRPYIEDVDNNSRRWIANIFTDCESTKYGTIRYHNYIKEG